MTHLFLARVRPRTVVAAAAALALAVTLTAAATPATAQTMKMMSGTDKPIMVNKCSPQHNPGTMGGYAYGPGFSPAYYPGRAYYYQPAYYSRTYYQPPVSSSAQLGIDYVNVTPLTMKTIDFGLIANGTLVAIVRDEGTFSHGAEIKHTFGISPHVFPLHTKQPVCTPLRVVYQNGTTWTNHKLPPENPAIFK